MKTFELPLPHFSSVTATSDTGLLPRGQYLSGVLLMELFICSPSFAHDGLSLQDYVPSWSPYLRLGSGLKFPAFPFLLKGCYLVFVLEEQICSMHSCRLAFVFSQLCATAVHGGVSAA